MFERPTNPGGVENPAALFPKNQAKHLDQNPDFILVFIIEQFAGNTSDSIDKLILL